MNGFCWQRSDGGSFRLLTVSVWALIASWISSPAIAQTSSKDVVELKARFSAKQAAPSETIDLLIDYSTKGHWYIYSPDNKGEYSVSTKVKVNADFLSANGTISHPKPEEKTDSLNETYRTLGGKGTFRLPYRIKAETPAGSHTAKADVLFMACNSVTQVCYQAATVTVDATIVLAANTSAATQEVSSEDTQPGTSVDTPAGVSTASSKKLRLDLLNSSDPFGDGGKLGGRGQKPRGSEATFKLAIEPTELRADGSGKLVVNYAVIDGYHIYAPDNKETPTTVTFDPDVVTFDGKPTYSKEPTVTEQFGLVLRELYGEGSFELPFRLKSDVELGELTLNATISYVPCTKTMCYPKVTVDPVALKVHVAAGNPEDEEDQGLLAFLLLAIGAGLFTLIMPCTYPMIPITISYFTKQAEARQSSVLPVALAYGAGIVLIFVVIGVVFGSAIVTFAVHGALNLLFGLLFVFFALVLFGALEIRLPSSLMSLSAKGTQMGGYFGVFVLGATLVITSFTCTAPFVGSLLALGAAGGERTTPEVALGMAMFGLTMAIPFVGLALFPSAVKKMPKSGDWLQTLKVTFGFLELAAALKFFSIAEIYYDFSILPRELFFMLWAIIAFVTGLYLLGMVPLKAVGPVSIGPRQMVVGLLVLMFGAYCLFGAGGHRLDRIMMAIAPPYASGPPPTASNHDEPWTIVTDDFDKGVAEALAKKKLAFINWTGKF